MLRVSSLYEMFSESTQELHGMGSSKSLAVFAAGAALVVSGCTGGEPEADPRPILPESSGPADPSPSDPSESEAAEAEAPEMPDAARERSFEGGAAFARYWVQVLNYAQRTGDSDALREVSAQACDSCNSAATAIDDVTDANGRIEGAKWSLSQMGFDPASGMESPIITSEVARSRETHRFDGTTDTNSFPRSEFTATFLLGRDDDGWRMKEVQLD